MIIRFLAACVVIVGTSIAINASAHPCLDQSSPDASEPLGPGVAFLNGKNYFLAVAVEKGKFRCAAEAGPDYWRVCDQRVSRITLQVAGELAGKQGFDFTQVSIPHSAYAGLENAWTVNTKSIGDAKLLLSFDVADGAGANRICLLFDRGNLVSRAEERFELLFEQTTYGESTPSVEPSCATLIKDDIVALCQSQANNVGSYAYCTRDAEEQLGKKLAAIYKERLRRSPPSRQKSLRKSQSTWVKYQKNHCDYVRQIGSLEGEMFANSFEASCLLGTTAERICELESLNEYF